jgi:hypothetical protein
MTCALQRPRLERKLRSGPDLSVRGVCTPFALQPVSAPGSGAHDPGGNSGADTHGVPRTGRPADGLLRCHRRQRHLRASDRLRRQQHRFYHCPGPIHGPDGPQHRDLARNRSRDVGLSGLVNILCQPSLTYLGGELNGSTISRVPGGSRCRGADAVTPWRNARSRELLARTLTAVTVVANMATNNTTAPTSRPGTRSIRCLEAWRLRSWRIQVRR